MLLKIVKNDYFLNLFNKIYVVIMGVFSTAFLTRYLGIELRGDFSYVIQINSMVILVLSMGLNQSYSYYYRKLNRKIYSEFLNIYSFQLVIYLCVFVGLSFWIRKFSILYFYVCLLIPFSVMNMQMESAMAVENIRLKIKVHIFNATLKMVIYAILYFCISYKNLFLPIMATIVIELITSSIYIISMRIKPNIINIKFVFLKKALSFSWLPMITMLLNTLNYNIDILFLKHLSTTIDLSLYATAAGIMNYVWLIPDAFKEVLISRVARSDKINTVTLSIKISLLSMIILNIGFILFGKVIIRVLYGSEFINTYGLTIILFFGGLSMVVFKIIGVVFLAEGKRLFNFLILLVSVIINVIANLITIPRYGMYGAAISSVLSYSLCGLTFLIYFAKQKNIKITDIIFLNLVDIKKILYIKKGR